MTDQEKLESEIIKEFRANFRENVDQEFDHLKIIVQEHIENKKYKEVINLILKLEKWPEESQVISLMKMEWWESFLRGNMHENSDKKIQLIGIKNETLIFDSIEQLYSEYIKKKNSEIWLIHNRAFTKIFVEFLVDAVISSLDKVKNKLEFINSSIIELKKTKVKGKYFLNEFSNNLNYYKEILELLNEENLENQLEIDNRIKNLEENNIFLLRQSLIDKDYNAFFEHVKVIYSSIPYQLFNLRESYFHTVFHVALMLINKLTISEDISNLGRGDTVVITNNCIYIFELKMTNSEEALEQIHEKKYYGKYLTSKKSIELIGVSFDEKKKNVSQFKYETYRK